MLAFLGLSFAAEPAVVVAVGDGLVAGASALELPKGAPADGGWVAVLADCLEERAPKRFTVVDRVVPGETLESARKKLASLGLESASAVVVALGSRELGGTEPVALRAAFSSFLAAIRPEGSVKPALLLVSTLPPTKSQRSEPASADLDRLTSEWNAALAELAKPGHVHVDLLKDWPHDDATRAALTVGGATLSDPGHAKVAAAVCDALVATPQR